MRKVLGVLALTALLAGCGSDNKTDEPAPAATAAAADPEAATHALDGYTEGVKRYYGEPHDHEGEGGDVEAEYHQPPKPPVTTAGGKITLTGSEIGVRMQTTVTKVEPEGDFLAVYVDAVSDGIAMFAGPIHGELTFPGGKVVANDATAEAECTKTLQGLWVAEGEHAKGCLLFPVDGDEQPEQVQVALETVPAEAGGIWTLQ